MTINIGDKLPEGTLAEFIETETEGCALGPNKFQVTELAKGKKIAIFGLPGAFTPTCSAQHVPGYVANADALKAKGVDEIWCISVNDAFVMGAWGRDQKATGIVRMMADGNGDFSKALGLDADFSKHGMGTALEALLDAGRRRRRHPAEPRAGRRFRSVERRNDAQAAGLSYCPQLRKTALRRRFSFFTPDNIMDHALTRPRGNLRSIYAMLLAVSLFSLMDTAMKLLSEHYPAMQVAALRALTSLPLVLAYVGWRGAFGSMLQIRWSMHLLRAVLGIAMLALFAFGLQTLSLAEAYTIFFIAPALITALSVLFLKERVNFARWVAIARRHGRRAGGAAPERRRLLHARRPGGARRRRRSTRSRRSPRASCRAPTAASTWCCG